MKKDFVLDSSSPSQIVTILPPMPIRLASDHNISEVDLPDTKEIEMEIKEMIERENETIVILESRDEDETTTDDT